MLNSKIIFFFFLDFFYHVLTVHYDLSKVSITNKRIFTSYLHNNVRPGISRGLPPRTKTYGKWL